MHPKLHLFILLWMSNLIKLHHHHNLFESQDCKSLQNFSSNLLLVDAYANHLCLTCIWMQFMHPSCIQFVMVWKYHPSIHPSIWICHLKVGSSKVAFENVIIIMIHFHFICASKVKRNYFPKTWKFDYASIV